MIKWNLARFAETLLPLIAHGADRAVEAANKSIARFDGHYHAAYLAGLRRKLGLTLEMEGDEDLGADLLTRMAENKADFTLTFRALSEAAGNPDRDVEARAFFLVPAAFDAWAARWRERLSHEHQSADQRRNSMRAVNPMFIPRNHRVEAAIADAQAGSLDKFHELIAVLADHTMTSRNSRIIQKHPRFMKKFSKPFAVRNEGKFVCSQLALFEGTGRPQGLQYRPDIITAGQESDLIAHIQRLPLAPFQFGQYEGKRRVVSFGHRYDFFDPAP